MIADPIIEAVPRHMRHPAWRWELGLLFAADPRLQMNHLMKSKGDQFLGDVIRFHRGRGELVNNPQTYSTLYPALYEAHLINLDTKMYGGYKWHLEALLMTDAPSDEIAKQLMTEHGAETIETYKKVYFDVDFYKESPICLQSNLMASAIQRKLGPEDCDYTWKIFAYQRGYDDYMKFVDFRLGARLPSELRDWFVEVTKDRVAYGGFQTSSSTREMFTEQAMQVVNAATANWRLDADVRKSLNKGQGQDLAAKQFLNMIQMVMIDPNLEADIRANTSAVEPRLNFNYDLLEPSDQGVNL